MNPFDRSAFDSSRAITRLYSTSFSLGIRMLHTRFRDPIYGVYGFVRYADEIVDTFYDHNQEQLLDAFSKDTYASIDEKLSLNPVLHAFQCVVHDYKIERELIDAFLCSMRMDLLRTSYDECGYGDYIYGSAEVVGLMCLRVFTEGNDKLYQSLKPFASRLGAAFQKVNFLRDVQSDYEERGRVYFPNVNFERFTEQDKKQIEDDIQNDFNEAWKGIVRLPRSARFGVYLAYIYYTHLFKQIQRVAAARILQERIRVPDNTKLWLLARSYVRDKMNLL
jgi:15-cis-phytoene synthase